MKEDSETRLSRDEFALGAFIALCCVHPDNQPGEFVKADTTRKMIDLSYEIAHEFLTRGKAKGHKLAKRREEQ